MALLYSILINGIDVESDDDVDILIRTVQGEETMYSEKYRAYCDKMNQVEDDIITEIAVNTLTERYIAAQRLAEIKRNYGGDVINFVAPSDKSQDAESVMIAKGLVTDKNLSRYKLKSNGTEDDNALRYTAFNVTFNNVFNINEPVVKKLADKDINLRDELVRNGIYRQESNRFDENAWNEYIQSEKFLSIGLTPEETAKLCELLKRLPQEVDQNYEILSGNFDVDKSSFEEISKIYALGEIINNIRNYFNKEKNNLGNLAGGLELDKTEPARIEGDFLFLKGKINGTVTNIKYDLRSGKLYMNSFIQKVVNEEKFVIGNSEPTTEIGNLNSFQDILNGYSSDSFVSISDDSSESVSTTQPEVVDDSDNQDKKEQKTLKSLTENKLIEDLGYIGEIVKKRAEKRGTKNSLINNFLRSFNILPDNGNLKTIDVDGGSSLYILLESIKNTDDSTVLNKFSDRMSRLMESCGFKRGSNIEYPENEVDFDVENMPDSQKNIIVPIQEAINNFFKENGEKANIKDKKDYFDGSFNLSFANVIVQNFCKKFGAGWELNISNMEYYVKTVQDCELDSVLSSIT